MFSYPFPSGKKRSPASDDDDDDLEDLSDFSDEEGMEEEDSGLYNITMHFTKANTVSILSSTLIFNE